MATTTDQWSNWSLTDSASGRSLIEFTSLIDADFRRNGRVTTEPVENGGFSAYNKTQSPDDIYATLGIEGTAAELQDALDTLSTLKQGLTLFSFVTPDQEYKNLTLEGFDYRRTREDGMGVLYASLHMVEVRLVTTQYSTTKLSTTQVRRADNASSQEQGQVSSRLYEGLGRVY